MRKKTHQEFLDEVKRKNAHVVIIGEYTRDVDKVEVECVYCHRRFYMTASSILAGKKCEPCAHKMASRKTTKTHEQFIEQMYNINPDVKIVGQYIRAKKPIECFCLIHNKTFFSAPTHLLRKQCGCPDCISDGIKARLMKPHDQFVSELMNINPNIEPLEQYRGASRKIKFHCKKCNNTWDTTPGPLLAGYGCPFCYESHGEKDIVRFLDKNGYEYKRQMKFPNVLRGVGNHPLSYDFYIPSLNLLIEYQGEFHDYRESNVIQTKEAYEIQHEHDKRKRKFAKENNYNLLEIWYKDKHRIDEVMKIELDKYKNPVTTTA